MERRAGSRSLEKLDASKAKRGPDWLVLPFFSGLKSAREFASRGGRGRSSAFNTAFSSLVYGTMDFPCPIISDNIHGWGPTKPPEIFSDVPYAPFSKGDKLGKVADFTFSNRWGQVRSPRTRCATAARCVARRRGCGVRHGRAHEERAGRGEAAG